MLLLLPEKAGNVFKRAIDYFANLNLRLIVWVYTPEPEEWAEIQATQLAQIEALSALAPWRAKVARKETAPERIKTAA